MVCCGFKSAGLYADGWAERLRVPIIDRNLTTWMVQITE
jgi:hypothetical protein